jgi:NAD(P)-dependent dehydrogenase (short-subunit alcohol dehydrogenase family)
MEQMTGKLCLVTGANSGIGLATATQLARMGAHVVMVCRDPARGAVAQAQIRQASDNHQVDLLQADLADLSQVRRLAEDYQTRYPRLDVLIHNAGLMKKRREVSADGHELQLAVHFLAPFLLTHALRDALEAAPAARVVSVASMLHRFGNLDFDDLHAARRYSMWRQYGASKLATIVFTYELARRLENTNITANCLHPGVIGSNIESNPRWLRPFLASPETGARTPVYLASSPELEGVTGRYFIACSPKDSSPASRNSAVARQLWRVGEDLTGARWPT